MTPPAPETAAPLTLGDHDFDAALAATDLPVLVDFHATWCPPCRALAPTVDDLARTHADRLRVAKVDIDENPALVERFGIASVPTLLLLRDGEVVERLGAVAPPRLVERVDGLL